MSSTRITRVTVPAAVAILAAACATASAQSFATTGSDIIPRVVSGQMTTGAKDDRDPTGTEVVNVRVYPYYFQSNPDDPYFDQDPGFNAPAGSGLGASSTLSYNILSGLSYWDGTGPVTQTLPPANEAIQYKLGISSATVTGSSTAQPGFNLARVQANGAVHVHLNAFLFGPDGNADATDGVVATPGIYFVTLQAVDNGVASSQPLYIVYDNGLPSSVLDQARVYSRNSFAPLTNLTGHSNYPTDRGDFPSTWAADAAGTWGAAGSWNGPVPAAQADSAVFGQVITAPRTVTLASPQTVGHLAFDNANAYTLTGATLTLGDGSAPSEVVVNSGSHAIAAPVNLASHTTFNVVPAGSTLTVQSAITSNPGVRVAKEGAGTVVAKQLTATSLDVVQGTFRLLAATPTAAPTQLGELTVRDGATFDLNTGSAVISTTGMSSAGSVLAQVAAAYNTGQWDRPGITSSAAADPANNALTAVGTIDNSFAHLTSFQGVPVGDASVLLKYTYYGDANLDGKLNADDYVLLDRGFARQLSGWLNGDFNYDGVIDQHDYLLIDRTYALAGGGGLSPAFLAEREAKFGVGYVNALVATVPEPVGVLPAIACVALSVRRQSRGRRLNGSL